MCVNSVHFCHLVYSMFSQKFIFIFIFEYPLRIISELIKILVDTLIIYYTDYHEVDEDMMTSLLQGGLWHNVTDVGITFRFITDSPSNLSSYVASMCRHLKYSSIIRISMMSTKTGTPFRFMVVCGWVIEQRLMVLEFIEGICMILSIL